MALLRAKVDPTEIRVIGRWRSWAMIRYLHRAALDTTNYANRMLQAGQFTIQEHSILPADVLSTLQLYPPNTPPTQTMGSDDATATHWNLAESIIG